MNWLALIPKRLLLELLGGLLSALAIWALNSDRLRWRAEFDRLSAAETAQAAQHKEALTHAQTIYNAELAAIRSHVAGSAGVGPIVLRVCTRVSAGAAPRDGGSTPAAVGQPVPSGGTEPRADGDARQSPMLTAFAAVLDQQVAALRAEQAVK